MRYGRSAPPGLPRRREASVLHQGRGCALHDAAGGDFPDQAARGIVQHAAVRPRARPHHAHSGRRRRVRVRRSHPRAVRRARRAHEGHGHAGRGVDSHRWQHDDRRVSCCRGDRRIQGALSRRGADAVRRQLGGGTGSRRRAHAGPGLHRRRFAPLVAAERSLLRGRAASRLRAFPPDGEGVRGAAGFAHCSIPISAARRARALAR